jgi:hypothetical protein
MFYCVLRPFFPWLFICVLPPFFPWLFICVLPPFFPWLFICVLPPFFPWLFIVTGYTDFLITELRKLDLHLNNSIDFVLILTMLYKRKWPLLDKMYFEMLQGVLKVVRHLLIFFLRFIYYAIHHYIREYTGNNNILATD